jgi:hypothetical protein
MTETTTLHEDAPHTSDAEGPAPNGNWFVLLAPDGEITVNRMPPIDSPPEITAFYRDALRNLPPDAVPKGVLGMGRGNNLGTVSFHFYEGAAPSREELRKLRPLTLARYSARIFSCGENRYEEDFPGLFGLRGEPAIVRAGPEICAELAASCTGKRIAYGIRPDGLRYGGSAICDFAGFIEDAQPDGSGIVATLVILSPGLAWDLESLDAAGELESARLCLSHSARAIPRRTGWGLHVFDLTHASANQLNFTSLAHSPGTFIVRRLAIDESLGPDDFRPTERLHVPRAPAATSTEGEATAEINPGAITTPKRADVAVNTHSWGPLAAGASTRTGGAHNLGRAPILVVISGHADVNAVPTSADNTNYSILLTNISGASASGTATVYFF